LSPRAARLPAGLATGRAAHTYAAGRDASIRPRAALGGLGAAGKSMDLPDYAIEARGLYKTYAATKTTPAKTALNGVDLAIPRGSIFGLLGPNGAGKSTFINILAGLVKKTAGTVRIWDRDIDTQSRDAK